LTEQLRVKYLQRVKSFPDHVMFRQALVVLLIVCLSACSNDPEPTTKVFRGSFSGTGTIWSPQGALSLDRCNANASDGGYEGLSYSLLSQGTGDFNVLGPVTFVGSHCADPSFQRGRIAEGRWRLRTASGDVLMVKYHGSVTVSRSPEIFVGRTENQVVGGTGQFAQADGTFVCELRGGRRSREYTGRCEGDIRF